MNRYHKAKPVTRTAKLDPEIQAAVKTEFRNLAHAFKGFDLEGVLGKNTFYEIMRGEFALPEHINVVEMSWRFYKEPVFKVGYLIESAKIGLGKLEDLAGRKVTLDEWLTELVKVHREGLLEETTKTKL